MKIHIHAIFYGFSLWLRKLTSVCVQNKYAKDKRYPWRSPIFGVILPLRWPFNKTWYLTDVTHHIIHFTHISEKPIFHCSSNKFPFHLAISFSHVYLNSHPLVSSTLSVICCPTTKSDWVLHILFDSPLFSLA